MSSTKAKFSRKQLGTIKPTWIKTKLPSGEGYLRIARVLRGLKLHTVCEEALCPNIHECWSKGTVTFMILGRFCTRACRFCNVERGWQRGATDLDEPERVAKAVEMLGIDYAVVTSVCRDDLLDGGADIFSRVIKSIKSTSDTHVEVLVPDFSGDVKAIKKVLSSDPDVVGHNIETVERLTPYVRDRRASYKLSLKVLKSIKELRPNLLTKSSIMLGLGERKEEVISTMKDLLEVGVDILTIGQYLSPSKKHLPVQDYIHPDIFGELKDEALSMGFKFVLSGPLVRSSYIASEIFRKLRG